MGDTLVCPKCRERLWVGDIQIPLVTCPKCLARVINPGAEREPLARATVARTRMPAQVIALEDEASSDVRNTTRWLAVLAVALVVGGGLICIPLGMNLLSGLMIGGAVLMGVAIAAIHRKSAQFHEPTTVYYKRVQRGGDSVLEYATARKRLDTGAFHGGFLLAVGIWFGTMMATSAGRDVSRIVAGIAFFGGAAALLYLTLRAAGNPERLDFYKGLVAGTLFGAFGCGPCSVGALIAP